MGKRILLVEGKDDLHLVTSLCMKHGVPKSFEIETPPANEASPMGSGGGVENLLDVIEVLLEDGELERFAIIVDADNDVQARWASMRDRVKNHVLLPPNPNQAGTIARISDDFREMQISIWVMPNNRLPGILEDFVAFLIPADDPNISHVDQFLDGIPKDHRKFSAVRRPKARIHAWLAVQEVPGRPLGTAITSRYLSAETDTVTAFVAWLRAALVD